MSKNTKKELIFSGVGRSIRTLGLAGDSDGSTTFLYLIESASFC